MRIALTIIALIALCVHCWAALPPCDAQSSTMRPRTVRTIEQRVASLERQVAKLQAKLEKAR